MPRPKMEVLDEDETMSLSGSSSQQPAQFVQKLWEMVHSPLVDCIQWSPDQTGFSVEDVPRFSSDVLPMFYKHNNYSSFVRQLNLYGFQRSTEPRGKVRVGQHLRERFEHPFFRHGRADLLASIKRKVRRPKTTVGGGIDSTTAAELEAENNQLQERVARLETAHATLEHHVATLSQQNEQLRAENRQFQQTLHSITDLMARLSTAVGVNPQTLQQQQQQERKDPILPAMHSSNNDLGLFNMMQMQKQHNSPAATPSLSTFMSSTSTTDDPLSTSAAGGRTSTTATLTTTTTPWQLSTELQQQQQQQQQQRMSGGGFEFPLPVLQANPPQQQHQQQHQQQQQPELPTSCAYEAFSSEWADVSSAMDMDMDLGGMDFASAPSSAGSLSPVNPYLSHQISIGAH